MAVVTPLNNFLGPEGDTVTVDEQLLNTEYPVVAGSPLPESLSSTQYYSSFHSTRVRAYVSFVSSLTRSTLNCSPCCQKGNSK